MKLKQLNKKGSHAGMMISFVIFITFLAFIYSTIEPSLRTQPSKTSLLGYLKNEIMFASEGELITITATNTSNLTGVECALLNHSKFLDPLEYPDSEINLLIEDKNQNKLYSEISLNIEGHSFLNISENKEYVKAYYSKENFSKLKLITPPESCTLPLAAPYIPSIALTKQIVFETKLTNLVDIYNESYSELKEEFHIPRDTDFSFSFKLVNDTLVTTEEVEVLANVFSGEYLIPYLDSEANTVFGTLKINIW
ncbi:hypothetical protein HOD88_01640 [archaeon]|jgi:hypothetical protein|nr:hypothetical protein [archaeon]